MASSAAKEAIADTYYYDKKSNLLLCDPSCDPDIVNIYLMNEFSGYRDLIKKIYRIIKDKGFKGHPIPLTVINGNYYQICKRDYSDVDMDKDINKVKSAIFMTWKERNTDCISVEFDDILQ